MINENNTNNHGKCYDDNGIDSTVLLPVSITIFLMMRGIIGMMIMII